MARQDGGEFGGLAGAVLVECQAVDFAVGDAVEVVLGEFDGDLDVRTNRSMSAGVSKSHRICEVMNWSCPT